jgi:hypothetical protein
MASTDSPSYPWYRLVTGNELEQGDILLECPRFVVPAEALTDPGKHAVQIHAVDAIVLTQSCDLAIRADGSCKAKDVILCPLHFKEALTKAGDPKYGKDAGWDEARTGKHLFIHVLNRCVLEACPLDFMLVDLGDVFTLNVKLMRSFAASKKSRVRLLPPYREHLSQAFARVFMRVGLPADIPPFGKKK